MHPYTMAPVPSSYITMRILNTYKITAEGTWLRPVKPIDTSAVNYRSRDMIGVKFFTTVNNVLLLNIEVTGMLGDPAISSRAFRALYLSDLSGFLIAQALPSSPFV